MKIRDLYRKHKDSLPDITLEDSLILKVKIINVPEKSLKGGFITLQDDTGQLDAVTIDDNIRTQLQMFKNANGILTLKGRLSKTEFENIVFCIQEIIF